MWQLITEIVFFIITCVTVFLMAAGIPGNFIGSSLLLIHGFIFPASRVSWWIVLLCFLMSVLCEIIESFLGIFGARHYGAGKAGMAASFIGGIFGAVLGNAALPIIGVLPGVLAGGFLATFVVEAFFVKKDIGKGARAGFGALLGRVISINIKSFAGLIIIAFMVKGFWL